MLLRVMVVVRVRVVVYCVYVVLLCTLTVE